MNLICYNRPDNMNREILNQVDLNRLMYIKDVVINCQNENWDDQLGPDDVVDDVMRMELSYNGIPLTEDEVRYMVEYC
jgi:hypothetical protein